MDQADVDLRVAMLRERARRAFKLPTSEDQTVEQRLAEVERVLTDLRVEVMSLAVLASENREEAVTRFENALFENEKRRGIVPD